MSARNAWIGMAVGVVLALRIIFLPAEALCERRADGMSTDADDTDQNEDARNDLDIWASDDAEETDAPDGGTSLGLRADLGIATAYNIRGMNRFREDSQKDQNAVVVPKLVWSIFETGAYLAYRGAYQLTGDNRAALVHAGVGHEQNLFAGFDKGVLDGLVTLKLLFIYYFFPFADPAVAGTGVPSYIEPLVGVAISTVVKLGLCVSYFHGVQPVDITSRQRYAYVRFTAGKTVSFNKTFDMDFRFRFGAKARLNRSKVNRFDLLFSWSLPVHLTEHLYLNPGVHFGWTDLETVASGIPDDPLTPEDEALREAKGGDEYMLYGAVNIGADF